MCYNGNRNKTNRLPCTLRVTIPKTANSVSLQRHIFLNIYGIITGSFISRPPYEINASITFEVDKQAIIHLSSKHDVTTVKKRRERAQRNFYSVYTKLLPRIHRYEV